MCDICKNTTDKLFDGLCETCELTWDSELSKISKIMPQNTPLKELFEATTLATKIKFLNKNNIN